MSIIYRGPSIDASNQVLVHLARRFQRRRFFKNRPIKKQELPVEDMFVKWLPQEILVSDWSIFKNLLL
jgi:hypothetical protein